MSLPYLESATNDDEPPFSSEGDAAPRHRVAPARRCSSDQFPAASPSRPRHPPGVMANHQVLMLASP